MNFYSLIPMNVPKIFTNYLLFYIHAFFKCLNIQYHHILNISRKYLFGFTVWSIHTYPSFWIILLSKRFLKIIVFPEKNIIYPKVTSVRENCFGHFVYLSQRRHNAGVSILPSILQACDLASFPHPSIFMCPSSLSPTVPQCSWWTEVFQLPCGAQLLRRRRNT